MHITMPRTAAVVTALTTALVVISPPVAAEAAPQAHIGSAQRADSSDVDQSADPTAPPTTSSPAAEDPAAPEPATDRSLVWWVLGTMVVVLGVIAADPLLMRRGRRKKG